MVYWLDRIEKKYNITLSTSNRKYIGDALEFILKYSVIDDIYYRDLKLFAKVNISIKGTTISKRINILEGDL